MYTDTMLTLSEIEQRVCDVTSEQLGLARQNISPQMSFLEDLGCDSLDMVELLMTMPVTDGQVILGKFFAALLLYAATVAITLIYPFVLLRFGNPDVGPIISTYLLVLLWGASLIAIGIFTSTISTNQINAFMFSFAIILVFYLLSFLSNTASFLPVQVSTVMRELSLVSHQDNFFNGVLTAKDVLYYVLVTGSFLFAAARFFESRRWR